MYKYAVSIEKISSDGTPEASSITSSFVVENHDDILAIIATVKSKRILDPDKAAALVTGLKLLGNIVLDNRRDPLFLSLAEPLRKFTKELKQLPTAAPR